MNLNHDRIVVIRSKWKWQGMNLLIPHRIELDYLCCHLELNLGHGARSLAVL